MGTVATNFLPNATGLDLGSVGQKWDAFVRNLTNDLYTSGTANPALSGQIRLASTDFIAWRNNANGADVTLSKTGAAAGNLPADVFLFGSPVETSALISTTSNPSATGAVRLAKSDSLNFRNNSNGADIAAISINGSDQVVVGGASGMVTSGPETVNGALTVTGAISGTSETLSGNLQAANVTATSTVQGATVTSTGALNVGTNKTQLNSAGLVTKYNNIATINGGVPIIVALQENFNVVSAFGTTTLYTVPSGQAGQYRLSWNMKVHTAAGSSSTLGPLTIGYTYNDGIPTAVSLTAAAQISAGTIATTSTANTVTTILSGLPLLMSVIDGTSITFSVGYAANPGSSMGYSLRIMLEYLG